MDLFVDLLVKLLPIYVLIFLGYAGGKIFHLDTKTLSKIVIYFVLPFVIFAGNLRLDIQTRYFILPIFFYITCILVCLLAYWISGFVYKGTNSQRNLIAFASGYGNYGIYGIPAATAVFGLTFEPLIIFMVIGFQLFQDTFGFFMVSKGAHTTKESISKVLHMPGVYAFLVGLILNFLGFSRIAEYAPVETIIGIFRQSLTFLGMFIIGLSASTVPGFKVDMKLLSLIFFNKFVIWPAVVVGAIVLDMFVFGLFEQEIHQILILLSFIPVAGLVPSFAQEADLEPGEVSLVVFISNFVSLLLIPLSISLFF
jgi:predicted permease